MKSAIIKIGFKTLAKAIEKASKLDPTVQAELNNLPENFSFAIKVFPNVTEICLIKKQNSFIVQKLTNPSLVIIIKDSRTALKLALGQTSVATAYAQRRIALLGSPAFAMVITRIVNRVETLLFPHFITKKLLKQSARFSAKDYLISWKTVLSLPF